MKFPAKNFKPANVIAVFMREEDTVELRRSPGAQSGHWFGREEHVTEASRCLVALAGRIAAAYVANAGPRAILLTVSPAW